MFKNKFLIKLIAFTLIFFTVGNSGSCLALAKNNNKGNFNKAFLEASDDTIVCYMEGFPITKSQIDEYGSVSEERIKEIEELKASQTSTYATTSNYRTIPTGYNQAIVRTSLKAPSYGQTNTQYYFTYQNGAKFASGLETKTWATIVGTAAGFVPKIGATITIMFTASSLYKSSIASKIRSYTNSGKKVKITESKSSYGTFYGVFAWTNRTIETHKTFTNGTVETITNLQYKK